MYQLLLRRLNTCFKPLINKSSTSSHLTHYDIIISGGGMVGLSFAAMVACNPLFLNKKILLLEKSKFNTYEFTEKIHNRVVAMTPISRRIFEDLGAWKYINDHRLQPIKQMKVFELNSNASLLLSRKNPADELGYIVENQLIISALANIVDKAVAESCTERRPGSLEVVYEADIQNTSLPKTFNHNEFPQVSFRKPEMVDSIDVTTSLLVGSDGFNSNIRKISGLHTIGWEHNQTGIVANLDMSDDYDHSVAWQRFVPSGPIAFLPLGPKKCSTTWSTTRPEANRLMSLNETEFIDEINKNMLQPSHRPTGIISALTDVFRQSISYNPEQFKVPRVVGMDKGSRAAFPLTFSHCTFYHAPRVALIGDAAHRLLPLSGQGVNMGFGDALSLAQNISQALSEGADIASPQHLRIFTNERQRSVVPMAAFIEGIQLLFTNDEAFGPADSSSLLASIRKLSTTVGLTDAILSVRGLGLDLVNSSNFVKNFFVEAAVTGRMQSPFS